MLHRLILVLVFLLSPACATPPHAEDILTTTNTKSVSNKTFDSTNTVPIAAITEYDTGSWTPVLTFATPGDLAVTYSIQTGTWTKIGNQVHASFFVATSAFTHTTASSLLRITGLQHTAASEVVTYNGGLSFAGITKANYTQFTPVVSSGTAYITINASAQGQSLSNVGATDVPTGGAVILSGTVVYKTTN